MEVKNMSNIEEMAKLQSKSKVYSIPKEAPVEEQASLEIFPLGLDDMGLLNAKEGMDMKEMADNSRALIAASLKIEEKDVVMNIKFMEEVMNAIMDLNGFSDKDMKSSTIKNFIDEKKLEANKSESA